LNETDPDPEHIELNEMTYDVAGGTEHFLKFEDSYADLLIGFCRLRFPGATVRRELKNAAVVRELHVYGSEAGIGATANKSESTGDTAWQHKGYGKRLITRAEELAREAGYDSLAIISGIGARQYYRQKLGYHQDGPYVAKKL
jgi:elongator complex protein 3